MTYSICTGDTNEETWNDLRLRGQGVTGSDDGRTDSARDQILRAAAEQFARRPFHLVSLDDILTQAEVTKGAMYFHFRSKHALAVAIIDLHVDNSRAVIREALASKLSGLETLIDMSYLLVVRDISDTVARAALYLMEAIGRVDHILAARVGEWADRFVAWARQARDDGDLVATTDPEDVARLVIAVSAGLRQVNDLDDAETYLRALEKAWLFLLPGMVASDRVDYFDRFVRRRTVIAVRNAGR